MDTFRVSSSHWSLEGVRGEPLAEAPPCPLDTAQSAAWHRALPALALPCTSHTGPPAIIPWSRPSPWAFLTPELRLHPLGWSRSGPRTPACPALGPAPAPLIICLPHCPVSCLRTETVSFVVISGHAGPAATPELCWVREAPPVKAGTSEWVRPSLEAAAGCQPLLSASSSPGGSAGGQARLERRGRGREAAGAHLRLCLDPQLFEIRPIWSRNAVKANISVHPDKLKVLLPFVAYYMVSVCPACHLGPTRVALLSGVTSQSHSTAGCPVPGGLLQPQTGPLQPPQ